MPPAPTVHDRLLYDLSQLRSFFTDRSVVVLSGAGCSTESGIPDYRGLEGRHHRRRPMSYQEFMGSSSARARYWSRSAVGWSRVSRARPNAGHRALADLEREGRVGAVITQNVDGLHQAAGSRAVLELHGSLSGVRCMECGSVEPRGALQQRLEAANPMVVDSPARVAPDGDADPGRSMESGFRVPACEICGGILKPDVVFFGETVPRERVARSWQLYEEADALLVAGSSLAVFSGRRFVLRAAQEEKPVAIVNLGATRCDEVAEVKIQRRLGEVLPRLVSTSKSPRG